MCGESYSSPPCDAGGIKRHLASRIHESPMRDLPLKRGIAAGSVMDRSARSLWRHIYARNLSCPAALPSPLSLFFSRLPRLRRLAPASLVNLDPGNAARRKGAQKEDGGGKGKRRLKYHEDIIRYRAACRFAVSPPSLRPYKTAFRPHL